MHRGHNRRLLNQPLELSFAEVRNADRPSLAVLKALLHRSVCIDVVGVARLRLAVAVFREHVVAASEWRGPMHQVEVEIVGAEVFERRIERLLNVIGMVRVVPELCGYEELFARDARLLDGIANGGFGAVDARGVDVAITSLQCDCDSSTSMSAHFVLKLRHTYGS